MLVISRKITSIDRLKRIKLFGGNQMNLQLRTWNKRILALILTLLLVIGMLPAAVNAQSSTGTVHVTIENTTWQGAPEGLTGEILSTNVPVYADSTIMSCLLSALEQNHYTWKGTGGSSPSAKDITYIADIINPAGVSLGEFDYQEEGSIDNGSGWMGACNDEYPKQSLAEVTVSSGDRIKLAYTCNYGKDLGCDVGGGETDPSDPDDDQSALPRTLSVYVPKGASVSIGRKLKHYLPYDSVDLTKVSDTTSQSEDRYQGSLLDGRTYILEVSMDGKGKYVETFKMGLTLQAKGITVKESDLPAQNTIDRSGKAADLYLNGTASGSIQLAKAGDTYQLHPLRNWQVVENTVTSTTTTIAEPEYHYQVLDLDGTSVGAGTDSKVLTVDENGLITAKAAGTAIVLVTYDTVYDKTAGGLYSAVWPENTGVLIVQVGAAGELDSGMTVNSTLNQKNQSSKREANAIDAELDTLYYLDGQEGAEYSFTPPVGTAVSVLQPQISGEKISYRGSFSSSGVRTNNGTVTLILPEGKQIVRLEKGDHISYQIVTVKKAGITITNQTNTHHDGKYHPGDKITVCFDKIYHPVNKLAAVYNFGAQLTYQTDSGLVKGSANSYNFDQNEKFQKITFTIPTNWTKDTFTLKNGAVLISGYGEVIGAHRDIDWQNGLSASFNAKLQTAYIGRLPDLTFAVEDAPFQHQWDAGKIKKAATSTADGTKVYTCKTCGTITTKAIPKASGLSLSASSYTYTGGAKTPSVTIKDRTGKVLKKGTDYTVSYASGRKTVGKYTVKISFKGNYSGSRSTTFRIVPKGTSISKLSKGKKKFTVKWKKQKTQTSGYQIVYSTSSKFASGNKYVTISKNKTTSRSITKLKSKKTYYVKIRTFKTVGGVKYYSAWSGRKSVKTK